MQCGGQGIEGLRGGDKVEQSLDAVVCGGLGDHIVLRHCLVNLRSPDIKILIVSHSTLLHPPVVDGDEDSVGGGGGGQQRPGVGDQLGPRLLRPRGAP